VDRIDGCQTSQNKIDATGRTTNADAAPPCG
jgi:hypothetical protein